jgi:hypothetical protein
MLIRIRVGSGTVNHRQDVIDWLEHNVGPFISKQDVVKGYDFIGTGWKCAWRQFGGGWFMDVDLNNIADAGLFKLRWRGHSVRLNNV